jgi:hypothetical protein
MTNEELFQDLKQFITVTVSQQAAELGQRVDGIDHRLDKMEANMATKDDIKSLDKKLDQVQDAIAETLNRVVETLDTTEQVRDLERRVTRLEHHSA